MTFSERAAFLQHGLVPALNNLSRETPAQWGKMDAQQMVEHARDAFKNASGKIIIPLITQDPERLQKMREFLVSDKPFRENTNAPFMPETPRKHKYASMEEAIEKLEPEITDFFKAYEDDPNRQILNPVFGELNFEQQVLLLYKHMQHHLKQFGVVA